jgi:hypothetical protein
VNTTSDRDQVGYGRPPKKTRWKKGQSGNPNRRRPRRTYGTIEIIDKLFQSPVEITINGEANKISALEAILQQLSLKEIQGDRRALRARLKYQEFAIQHSERRTEITFVDNGYTRALANASSIARDGHG